MKVTITIEGTTKEAVKNIVDEVIDLIDVVQDPVAPEDEKKNPDFPF